MNIKVFFTNPLRVCTYIISDEQNNAAIIDAGMLTDKERQRIDDYITKENLHPTHHLLTHGHIDHIYSAAHIKEKYSLVPYMHTADEEIYLHPDEQAISYGLPLPESHLTDYLPLHDGDKLHIGSICLQVIHTPGHTHGSVCYWCEEEKVLFSGDTIFMGSIGRTDLYGGDSSEMQSSLAKLTTLPADTDIYPGHGLETTLRQELNFNPFLNR